MSNEASKRLVHVGEFVAEVIVDHAEGEGAWAPYVSVADANKLDEVRDALRAGDLRRAATLAHRVYRLTPLTEAQRSELDRRVADADAHPEAAIPWAQVKADLFKRDG